MIIKKLSPGQRYLVAGKHQLNARFTVNTSNDSGFDFLVPNVDSRRRGSSIAVRDLVDSSEIVIKPIDSVFPSHTLVHLSLTLLEKQRIHDVQLDFPPFDVSNLSTFTLGTLVMTPEGLAVDTANFSEDLGLARTSSEIRSVARSTLGSDALLETQKRSATIIVDVSSSMKSLTAEQFQAMCQFAGGVLAEAASGRTIRFCTSAGGSQPVQLKSSEVEEIPKRNIQFNEAGWSLDMGMFSESEALVVISDDFPAALFGRKSVHLLTSRLPMLVGGTYTVFNDDFVRAVRDGRTEDYTRDAKTMLNTLTGGK